MLSNCMYIIGVYSSMFKPLLPAYILEVLERKRNCPTLWQGFTNLIYMMRHEGMLLLMLQMEEALVNPLADLSFLLSTAVIWWQIGGIAEAY